LERDHPARVFRRQCAYLIESPDLVCGELDLNGRQILTKLIDAFRSYDDGCDKRLGENPGQGDGGYAGLMGLRDGAKDVEDTPGTLLIHKRKIKSGAARVLGLLIFAGVFA
jgi:hypothetical protein